jgi:Outer membrane protein beta-barrel domain
MKRIYMALAALLVAGAGFAQTGSTNENADSTNSRVDTIKVGNFIIIKKNRNNGGSRPTTDVSIERKPYKPTKISTNWWIFDLGFANVNDKTNYAEAQGFLRSVGAGGKPGKDDLKLRANKSSNVNIWVVMQRLNLAKGYVNLKYGLGLEMFNFRYENSIRYNKTPNYIYKDSISFSKDKLYAGYATVPLMLNINTSPGRKKGLSISAGISAGYLVGSHTKEVSSQRGKEKTKGDLGLEKFRLAYVGELGIGPIRLFGSYSIRRLHEIGLEQYPYSLGIRFSNW